jgi:class 3 adenylate cyclase
VSAAVAYSASVGTLLFVATSRAAYAGDIRYYLAHQGYVATQKRMFEMNLEFTDRIRAFLPKEISERLGARLQAQGTTVLRAVDEVLAPAEKHVACLYTDIRGFTKGTKGGDAFISEGVIPNVIGCTSAIEDHHGIPRKIGDLLFGYFDAPSVGHNVVRCLRAACEIVDANARFNATNPLKIEIRRFVLMSTGRARVGNLGGFDSSIEITASGPPVNLLSRLDELTKNARFKDRVTHEDIVLCPATAKLLHELSPHWEMDELELESLGLRAADFEGIESVWAFRNNAHNRRRLLELGVALDSARVAPSALPN